MRKKLKILMPCLFAVRRFWPHTRVCTANKYTTLHCCNRVYLQHGGG